MSCKQGRRQVSSLTITQPKTWKRFHLTGRTCHQKLAAINGYSLYINCT
uniref:Uncharacterized protein n=1 Tax=Anguilla anguilla TaxID=7936 RepID=A0A0E9SA45_ANGAN